MKGIFIMEIRNMKCDVCVIGGGPGGLCAGFKVGLQIRGMGANGTFRNDGTPQWVFRFSGIFRSPADRS